VTVYNQSILDSASITSFGRYTLVLDEATTTYELIVQILADNPYQRDWRTEFNTVAGRYEQVDGAFTFHVERGQHRGPLLRLARPWRPALRPLRQLHRQPRRRHLDARLPRRARAQTLKKFDAGIWGRG
jgi:hypothetical protein